MPDAIRFRVADPGGLHRLTFDPARDAAFTALLADRIGAPFPQPHRPSGADPMLIWQGPQDMLIVGLGGRETALRQAIEGRAALLGDAGAGLVAFSLSGEGLANRIGHDRPGPGLCSRVMRLAGLRVTAVWTDDAPPRARLYVDRSHASYLAEWLGERWRGRAEGEAA